MEDMIPFLWSFMLFTFVLFIKNIIYALRDFFYTFYSPQ